MKKNPSKGQSKYFDRILIKIFAVQTAVSGLKILITKCITGSSGRNGPPEGKPSLVKFRLRNGPPEGKQTVSSTIQAFFLSIKNQN